MALLKVALIVIGVLALFIFLALNIEDINPDL